MSQRRTLQHFGRMLLASRRSNNSSAFESTRRATIPAIYNSSVVAKQSIPFKTTTIQTQSFHQNHRHQSTNSTSALILLPAMGLFAFLNPPSDDDEANATPEGRLIMCLKRSVLCVQRQQYDKAEQMLHLALRMAQDLQHRDGITYCYDVMANLALERDQLRKAHSLFVVVMQRLLQAGYATDDMKMLHISTKLAQVAAREGDAAKAELGFKWVLEQVDGRLKKLQAADGDGDGATLRELRGMTQDYYAQLLMRVGRYAEARRLFAAALEAYKTVHGEEDVDVVMLLNNLAVVCTNLNDLPAADAYIKETLRLAVKFPELYDTGIFQANHGMVLLAQGMLNEAQRVCSEAWRSAKRVNSTDGADQSDHCLQEVRRAQTGA